MEPKDKKNKTVEFKVRVSAILKELMKGEKLDSENKTPSFQLYVQDFLVGTMQMSCAAVGAYIVLLAVQWDKYGIPNDPDKLKSIGRCDMKTLDEILEKFITCNDGKLRNRKLEKIRAEQIANRESKSRAGIAGNEKRWGKSQSDEPEITEDRPETPVSNKQKEGELFYIGKNAFRIPVSEYIKENLSISTEQWHMKNMKGLEVSDVLNAMDKECIGKGFSDEEHISNTYKQIAKDMKKKPGTKPVREECPYTDDQLRLADAQKASGMGTPKWFDKKWMHLLKN